MEGDPDYVSMSPEYTASTPVGGEEDAANEVRRAVGSFNAKMLDKYGENDQEIPESDGYSPRAPSSPGYSSIWDKDDEGQSGGGGRRPHGGSKYIPQIPMSVLENYLSTKYGKSGVSLAGTGMMTGGGAIGANTMSNNNITGLPTMNIPVVATMPMAGMMPIQQGGAGQILQQPQGLQAQQQQQPQQGGQGTPGQQTGGGAGAIGPEPNAQGVKTFSIKL